MINILLFLLINNVYADVGLGTNLTNSGNGNYFGLSVGDYNHFNQTSKDNMNLYHYGFGKSSLTFGNGIELKLSASSGIILYGVKDNNDSLSPFVGFDVGGKLLLNTNSDIKSYYEWFPALSIGPQFKLDNYVLLVVTKWGFAVGDFDKVGIVPDLYPYLGAAFYLNNKSFNFGIDIGRYGSNYLLSLDSIYKFDNIYSGSIRIETMNNFVNNIKENNISILFKMGLF